MEKKKVGIITYCNYGKLNYGQNLQAYAMQRILKEMGLTPLTFRYIADSSSGLVQHHFYGKAFSELIYIFNHVIQYKEWKIILRRLRFERWLYRNIAFTAPCYSLDDLGKESEKMDYLLCGSDQVWNPAAFDPAYYLAFGKADVPRISYAASMGGAMEAAFVPAAIKRTLKKAGMYMERFQSVSVRESDAIPVLSQYTAKDVKHVLDPTLLVPVGVWRSVSVPVSGFSVKERFLFVYMLGKPSDHDIQNMKRIMKKRNIKRLIYVPALIEDYRIHIGTPVNQAGPGEFLWLLSNADFVYTDSFHGTAFSIIFERQLLAVKRNSSLHGRNSKSVTAPNRVKNLLRRLHMDNRFSDGRIQELPEETDYETVAGYLKEAQKESLNFLKAAFCKGESVSPKGLTEDVQKGKEGL